MSSIKCKVGDCYVNEQGEHVGPGCGCKCHVEAYRVIYDNLVEKLQHAGEQLVRYGMALNEDDRQSIEYTSGIDLEWYQAITQWKASGGRMPKDMK